MSTIVLGTELASLPIEQLLQQVEPGGIEIRDRQGNIVAFVLSPADHEEWVYAEARRDVEENREAVQRALERRGGESTSQLLEKANDVRVSNSELDTLAR